nr:NAD(P)H-dependent oxidoreductase [Kangiella sp. TOML190]
MNAKPSTTIAFAASNSSNSINKQLLTYASALVDKAKVEILDLNDFQLPLYSEDFEKQSGSARFSDKTANSRWFYHQPRRT